MEIPAIHMNGTSGEELLKQVLDAGSCCKELLKKLRDASPNGRDYYVKDPGALKRAEIEHRSRTDRVGSVLAELEEIAEAIADQNDLRKGR